MHDSSPHCQILLIGDSSHSDFREPLAWLQQHTHLIPCGSVDQAVECMEWLGAPNVILLVQATRNEFSKRDIQLLENAAPLARLVVLLGSWCEGELRTGKPWPGVIRVYWHQWESQLLPELSPALEPGWQAWGLPRTATVSERCEQAALARWSQPIGRLIAIHAESYTNYSGIAGICQQGGYSTVWCPRGKPSFVSGVVLAIWDGVSSEPSELTDLLGVVETYPRNPVVALLDFLRGQDRHRVLKAGVTSVIAKPFLLRDLLWHLRQAEQQPQRVAASAA